MGHSSSKLTYNLFPYESNPHCLSSFKKFLYFLSFLSTKNLYEFQDVIFLLFVVAYPKFLVPGKILNWYSPKEVEISIEYIRDLFQLSSISLK